MLKPLGSHVLVRPSGEQQATSGGIVLPDSARKRPTEGEVLAVGRGRILDNGKLVPVSVRVGDMVVYSRYSGTEITVEGEDLLLIDEESLLAVRD